MLAFAGEEHALRSRCRVLCVIAGMPAGGAERQLALLLDGLDRRAFEPGLLIFNAAEKVARDAKVVNPVVATSVAKKTRRKAGVA